MNFTCLVGRIVRDIELRYTANRKEVATFTLACERRFKQEGQPTADFIQCVAWNKVASILNQYTHKGSRIGVEGSIQTRSYDDKDGKRIFITEVLVSSIDLLDSKETNNQNQNNYNQGYMDQGYTKTNQNNFNQGYENQSYVNQNNFNEGYMEQKSDLLDISSDDLPF